MENEVNQMHTPYSSRSRRSLLEEERLRGNIAKIDNLIRATERKIRELESDKARTLRGIPSGNINEVFLSQTLRELEDARRRLVSFREERACFEKSIAHLAPKPAALQTRMKEQDQVARLAAERLGKDRQIGEAVTSLRQALQERAALTATMKESTARLEFAPSDRLLDAQRFDDLLASLPEDLLTRSEDHAAWFLGKQNDLKPYIVRDRLLVVPETLASHGVYHFGDRIELSDKEAQGFMREDRPAPTSDAPWRYAPPSIMTLETWDAATISAAEHGSTVLEVLVWEDWERDAKNKKRYDRAETWIPLRNEETAGADLDLPPTEDRGDVVTVKVKAKREFRIGSRDYNSGDVFDFPMHKWSGAALFRDGAIARP